MFFEVKFRSSNEYGLAYEAVNYKKIKNICRASDYYRLKNNIREDVFIRYDVISIEGERIDWIKNAFDYTR